MFDLCSSHSTAERIQRGVASSQRCLQHTNNSAVLRQTQGSPDKKMAQEKCIFYKSLTALDNEIVLEEDEKNLAAETEKIKRRNRAKRENVRQLEKSCEMKEILEVQIRKLDDHISTKCGRKYKLEKTKSVATSVLRETTEGLSEIERVKQKCVEQRDIVLKENNFVQIFNQLHEPQSGRVVVSVDTLSSIDPSDLMHRRETSGHRVMYNSNILISDERTTRKLQQMYDDMTKPNTEEWNSDKQELDWGIQEVQKFENEVTNLTNYFTINKFVTKVKEILEYFSEMVVETYRSYISRKLTNFKPLEILTKIEHVIFALREKIDSIPKEDQEKMDTLRNQQEQLKADAESMKLEMERRIEREKVCKERSQVEINEVRQKKPLSRCFKIRELEPIDEDKEFYTFLFDNVEANYKTSVVKDEDPVLVMFHKKVEEIKQRAALSSDSKDISLPTSSEFQPLKGDKLQPNCLPQISQTGDSVPSTGITKATKSSMERKKKNNNNNQEQFIPPAHMVDLDLVSNQWDKYPESMPKPHTGRTQPTKPLLNRQKLQPNRLPPIAPKEAAVDQYVPHGCARAHHCHTKDTGESKPKPHTGQTHPTKPLLNRKKLQPNRLPPIATNNHTDNRM